MSSPKRISFHDITNRQNQDPEEQKRQRDSEKYARNRDDILKRQRQARELKKQSTTSLNDDNIHQRMDYRGSPNNNTKRLNKVWLHLFNKIMASQGPQQDPSP